MKLRNKKTGEIDDFIFEVIVDRIDLYRRVGTAETKNIYSYNSLAELNDEWEDVKEPLIKNEKVCNAVRAWAEALDLRWFRKCRNDNSYTSKLAGFDSLGVCYTIVFGLKDLYNDDKTQNSYTLEELCGDNEE